MLGEIVAVGEEVLSGDVINSNAATISRKLADLGVFCRFHSVVGDIEEDIIAQLSLASHRSEIVVLCGGLGPTKDDLTKEAVAAFSKKSLYEDPVIVEVINSWFSGRNMKPTQNNFKQALVIEGSKSLRNENGTAPGVYLEHEGVHYFLLPGPPNELLPMFNCCVIPLIRPLVNDHIKSKTFKMVNIGESQAVTILDDLMVASEKFILAPYAKLNEVHIKATAIGSDEVELEKKISAVKDELYARLGKHIYSCSDYDLVDVLINYMANRVETIGIAESCTGGLISNWFIEKPGASQVFAEGFVTYSNESKIKRLGIDEAMINQFGAVSHEVAYAMAKGVIEKAGTTYSISVTGIAGPSGGSELKPVGLVYIGIGSTEEICVFEHRYMGNRDKIRNNSAKSALIHLWDLFMTKEVR